MDEGGGLFDTPEYYKAALEQAELLTISQGKTILELQNKVVNCNSLIDYLQDSNNNLINHTIKLKETIEDLIDQKAQSDIELAIAQKDIQDETTSMESLKISFTKLPANLALAAFNCVTQLYAGNVNWMRIQPLVRDEVFGRLLKLEASALSEKPVNTNINNSNITFDNAQFQGPMYEVKDNDNVILGGIYDGEEI